MKNSTYLSRKAVGFMVFLLTLCLSGTAQQVAKGLTAANGQYIGFYEYKPTDYASRPSEKFPIIIFLHGIGERGNGTSELPNVLGQGIPKYIANGSTMTFWWNGKYETFLVLSPQLSRNYGDWQDFYVDEMYKYARNNLNIDTNRVYLTGLSLGGGGVWHYASGSVANAKKFAAIAPVCGTCSVVSACNMASANLPIWAFHAQDDGVVGVGCTTSAIQNINNCNPAVKPLMTLYNDGGHFIWDRAYDMSYTWQNPSLFEWFLGQARNLPLTNLPPIANAGPDQSITHPTTNTVLNGSSSSDPDGTIARYSWSQISGPMNATIQTPANVTSNLTGMTTPGTYYFQLMVVDNRAIARRDTVKVTVNSGPPGTNLLPVAVAGSDQTITVNNITLSSWGSFDPDGSITGYLWTKLSGPATFNMPNNIYASCGIDGMVSGVYTFELRVTDNAGGVGRDTVQITVNLPGIPPANQAPVARAGSDITLTLPTSNCTLDGSFSSDADGTISSFAWSKLSGPAQYTIGNVSAATTTLSNLVQGTYSFQLQVTDNNGAIGRDTIVVTVNAALPPPPPANQPPNANAGSNAVLTLPTNSTTLNGSGSNDPDGTIASYNWSKLTGPAQYTIGNPTAASSPLTNLAAGSYTFRLVVTDNNGATAADTVQVTVNNGTPPPNQAPIAKAGADISLTPPANSTTFDGSGSYDPDGIVALWVWTKISGPSQYTIVSPNYGQTIVNNLVAGTYLFTLTVTDNQGATAIDTIQVTVGGAPPPPNVSPIAVAGNNVSITLPVNNTTLNGSSSSDPDGTIVSYNWVKIAGPAQFNIANVNAASTSVTNLVQGVYQFRLVVTDNNGAIASDTVQVTVNPAPPPPNQAPNANAGADITITLPVNSTTLNGTASSDPDGTISTYSWSRISGPTQFTLANASAASTGLSNLVQGTYGFRLVVTDNNGASDADTVMVTVNAAPPPPPPVNQAPKANAGTDITITLPVNSTTLNGTASSDPDGSIASYSWSRISGPAQFTIANPTSASTALTNLAQGTYSFRLSVTDNNGASSADTVIVTVNPAPNQPPVANAGSDISVMLPNPTIQLNGTASYDPDGLIASYSWVKISGPGAITIVNSTTAIPTVVGVQAGTYVFELTVTDNKGASAKDLVTVIVNASPNQLPVANAGNDTTIAVPSSTSVLNGSASYDPDGSISSYRWRQISGPANTVLGNANLSITSVSNLVTVGDYVFELTVTDNGGASRKDTVGITIVDNFSYSEGLTVYPNPAITTVNIRCVSDLVGQCKLNFIDNNGVLVKTIMFDKGRTLSDIQVSVADLKAGVYYVEVWVEKQKRMITKLIKQ